jgi:WS/DGAT/MGAT family acyltransferase
MAYKVRLSTIDAAFLLAETRQTPMHVAGLQVFELPAGAPPHFVSGLFGELRRYPVTAIPFTYRLSGGLSGKLLPSWEVSEDVDIDYHVRHSALPYPGGERELGVLVSRLHSNPMDLSRPLWEFHLIEGLADNRFAIYCKLHHALVDGVNSIRLINLSSDPESSDTVPIWADKSRPAFERRSGTGSLLASLPNMVQKELEALPSLARALTSTARAAAGMHDDPDFASLTEAPRTLFNVRIGGQRRVATQTTSLDRVRTIARAAGGTINDVVLAACGGALRHYLAELGNLPAESLVGSVPVALHRDAGDASGNAVTALATRLGTNVADVRERFEIIRRSSAAGKTHLAQMTPVAAMNYTMVIAAPTMLSWLPGVGGLVSPPYNLIISNVPGPRDTLYFHGAEMVAYYPVSQVGHGQALNITVLSYAGQLAFGFVACRDSVPSMQRLAVYTGEALDELERTFVRTPTKQRKARTPRKKKSGRATRKK